MAKTPRAEALEEQTRHRQAENERRAAAENERRAVTRREEEARRQEEADRAVARRRAWVERRAAREREKAEREKAERRARAERIPDIRAACVEAAAKGETLTMSRADLEDVYREVSEPVERVSRLMFLSVGISRTPVMVDPETASALGLLLAPPPPGGAETKHA